MAPPSMKRSKAEQKARQKDNRVEMDGGSDYGYGLGISLDHDHLKKMGMKSLPAAGSTVTVHGHAKVTHASESDGGQGPRRSMSLQVTHLSLARHAGTKAAKVKLAPAKPGSPHGGAGAVKVKAAAPKKK